MISASGRAVFAFERLDEVQALFKFREAGGVHVHFISVMGKTAVKFAKLGGGLFVGG